MKRLFIDANILLDAILERPHDPDEAMELLALGERRQVRLVTTAISIGVVLFNLQRNDGGKKGLRLENARKTLMDLLACLEVVPLDAAHFLQSATSTFGDIEDGVQYFAASAAGPLQGVITRDTADFKGHVSVSLFNAKEALAFLKRDRLKK